MQYGKMCFKRREVTVETTRALKQMNGNNGGKKEIQRKGLHF